MNRTGMAMCAALAAAVGSGCGTFANLVSGDPQVYGGMDKDVQFAQTALPDSGIHRGDPRAAVFVVFLLADFSVTFVADTLTLPLVVLLRHNPRDDDTSASRDRSGKGAAPHPADTCTQPSAERSQDGPLPAGVVSAPANLCP
jgi:hypothetical protein